MNDETFQDDILFDRLVDGELSEIERRRLLESLDTRPEGWRRCALAFLEAQSWRGEFGQLTRERGIEQPANTTLPLPLGEGRGEGKLRTRKVPSPCPLPEGEGYETDVSNASSDSTRLMKRGLAALAIAAGLMVAFMLGGMQRQAGPSANQIVGNDARQESVAAAPSLPEATDGTQPGDAVTMWVLDDGGKTRPVRVPLMEASVLDRERGVQFQPGLSSDLRSHLQQRGYDVQSKQRYAPIWLEDGRQMIVPVEDTKIVPVRNVF